MISSPFPDPTERFLTAVVIYVSRLEQPPLLGLLLTDLLTGEKRTEALPAGGARFRNEQHPAAGAPQQDLFFDVRISRPAINYRTSPMPADLAQCQSCLPSAHERARN